MIKSINNKASLSLLESRIIYTFTIYRFDVTTIYIISNDTFLLVNLTIGNLQKLLEDYMHPLLEDSKEDLKKICQDLKVQRLYAFGSAVSGHFRDDSDIDFLIAFPDSLSVKEYTQNYFSLHYQLRDLFHREIDIVTERSLSNPYLIESINESKALMYEA